MNEFKEECYFCESKEDIAGSYQMQFSCAGCRTIIEHEKLPWENPPMTRVFVRLIRRIAALEQDN